MAVDVQLACGELGIPATDDIRDWVEFATLKSGRDTAAGNDIAVRVVDIDEMRGFNRRYRNQDKPTNVLSFPTGSIAGLPGKAARQLGDLVVCAAVVNAEAMQQGKAVTDHWAHMLVHGVLHLLGYDHDNAADASEMERLETAILAARGVPDPYASRQ